MTTLADLAGDYAIVSALDPSLALDVSGGSMANGANVQVYAVNYSDAQAWRVSGRDDGTLRVTSRLTGKCLDVAGRSLASGTNVQMYAGNDSRAQRWLAIGSGRTATVAGEEVPLHVLTLADAPLLALDVSGGRAVSGGNVQAWTANGTDAQLWALVPIPAFRDGGTYELVPMVATSMRIDVAGNGSADGTNVRLYPHNSTNAQKFHVTDEGDGFSIRHVGSGKYVDVAAGAATSGTNVQTYRDNDTRAQRWALTPYGTTVVLGKACQVVRIGSMVDGTGAAYVMDVASAMTTSGTNVQIYASNGTLAQRFALLPTLATDPTICVPSSLGVSREAGQAPEAEPSAGGIVHPSWECDDAWVTEGPNHYQYRSRRRYMRPSDSGWGEWSDWGAWADVAVVEDGTRCWLADGEDAGYALSDAKSMQLEFQVRCVGVGQTASLIGAAAGATCTLPLEPTVAISGAAMSGDGLHVSYSSDYGCGRLRLVLSGGPIVGEAEFGQLGREGTVLVPMGSLSSWPEDGATFDLSYRVGTDQRGDFGVTHAATVGVAYDTDPASAPSLAKGPGRTLVATVPHAGTERMWLVVGDAATELEGTVGDSATEFVIPYPFGVCFELWTSVEGPGGWSTDRLAVAAGDPRLGRPCHAWTFEGGSLALEVRDGEALRTERSSRASHEASELDSRTRPTVDFGAMRDVSFTAEGALVDGLTDADVADFEALPGTHALYRSPHGHVCRVAVTSVSTSHRRGHQVVAVEMVEEAT